MSIESHNWMQRRGMANFVERWSQTVASVTTCARLRHLVAPHGASSSMSTLNRLGLGALEHLEHPWTPLALCASAAARELQPRWLTNHGWRAYAWGTLLALDAKLEYDKTLFFAACMLHGIGLTPHAATPPNQCFAVRGARAASLIMRRARASEDQLHRVAEAITLHQNFEVGVERGVEAHLLHAGALMDVFGQRIEQVPALLQRAVLGAYPRLDFKNAFCNCVQAEAQLAPSSRLSIYVQYLGFVEQVQRAAFDE